MTGFRWVLVAGLLSAGFVAGAAETLPAEVSAAFDQAVMVEDAEEFAGSYTSVTASMVQKPNGKSRHETEMVIGVERSADGAARRKLVKLIRDGEDLAEKHREDIEAPDDRSSGDEDEGDGLDFVAPWGEDIDRYVFDPPSTQGSKVIQSFRPDPEQDDDVGLASGQLSWHRETLDPISASLEVVKPPKPLKSMRVLLEFERRGGVVYVTRMVTDGLASVLLMKREFHVDVHWTDIEPRQAES